MLFDACYLVLMSKHVLNSSLLDENMWDSFVISSGGSFLQSWAWGEFQKKVGFSCWRLTEEENGRIQAAALAVRRELPFGWRWLYVPRGLAVARLRQLPEEGGGSARKSRPLPLQEGESRAHLPAYKLINQLLELAEGEKAVFVRMDPLWPEASGAETFLSGSGWRKSEWEVQPRHTMVLSLDKPEGELLAAMHSKTRYNVGLAFRRGVRVVFSRDPKYVNDFLRLSKEVTSRGGFHFHPDDYYRTMLEVLGPEGVLELAAAEQGGEVLAVYFLISYGGTVTYAHGATSSNKREVMASHLLMWEAIRRARERGAARFDFFGAAPAGAGAGHPWAGITRFKEGFGGRREDYLGAYDYVRQPGMYAVFNLARRARGVLR